jgi:ribosomal protein S18 acetylase RimI-like enzyme
MTPPATVHLGGAPLAEALFDAIRNLYDEVFSQPPFAWEESEPEDHRKRLMRVMAEPTFGLTVALAEGALVGFAYGYTSAPDSPRWTGFTPPLSAGLTAEWPGRTFALVDLAVRADWRGKGIGRQLVDELLGSRQEERAVLKTEPEVIETGKFYVRTGWRRVGRRAIRNSSVPLWDVYVREFQRKP